MTDAEFRKIYDRIWSNSRLPDEQKSIAYRKLFEQWNKEEGEGGGGHEVGGQQLEQYWNLELDRLETEAELERLRKQAFAPYNNARDYSAGYGGVLGASTLYPWGEQRSAPSSSSSPFGGYVDFEDYSEMDPVDCDPDCVDGNDSSVYPAEYGEGDWDS